MPSASSISLNDGQATPVSHSFDPLSVTPRNTVLVNREAATSAGQMQLILGLNPASSQRPTNRVSVRFNMPTEHVVDGVTKVSHTARFSSDAVLPEQMTQAERDNFAAFVGNAITNAIVSGYSSDLDPMY